MEERGLPRLRSVLKCAQRRQRCGEFDLIGVGRMHIANPDFVNKVRHGRLSELRLYNKAVDLGHLMAQIEPGLIEDERKVAEV